jgi:ketosteroid isomerase-like protein
MSEEENVAIVRTLFGAFFRRDNEVMTALLAPDVEWDATHMGMVPDLAGLYRGPEGTTAFWGGWLRPWRDLRFDYELRAHDDHVAALIRNQRQWGRQSGIESELPPYAWVYEIRDGRIVRGTFYDDHGEALRAIGLGEV